MSEFTYACPVCHQHLKCSAAHAGTVMKCPTCYQRIVAPQAPSQADSKLILTGQKYVEKKTDALPPRPQIPEQPAPAAAKTGRPIGLILTVVGGLAALGAAWFVFTAKPAAKPVAWQTSDIGAVGLAGAFSQAPGQFIIKGAGADVWNKADAFHYVFQPQAGDCTVITRVIALNSPKYRAKVGVMIRESLAAEAKYTFLFLTPESGAAFERRPGTAETSRFVGNDATLSAPYWLGLTRSGDVFTAYTSATGGTWKLLGAVTNAMNPASYVGLAVCGNNLGTLCEARFDQVAIKAGGDINQAARR